MDLPVSRTRRFQVLVRNIGIAIPDLPEGVWAIVRTPATEAEARSCYFRLRPFLEQRGASCLVIEAPSPPLGPPRPRLLVSHRATADVRRIPEPVRLSREQLAAFDLAAAHAIPGPTPASRPHKGVNLGAWGSALAGAAMLAAALLGLGVGRTPPEPATMASIPGSGALVVVPDPSVPDQFLLYRLQPDGSRGPVKHLTRAELARLDSNTAAHSPSLAESMTRFARVRAND